jgi:hypothetical protein
MDSAPRAWLTTDAAGILESVMNCWILPTCVLVASGCLHAQSERCPVLAKLPADLKDYEAPEDRPWFELRQCRGETVVVNAYVKGQSKPALTVQTDYDYPAFLSHTRNVLVLESVGGTAEHVMVIAFQNGRPAVRLKRTAGGPIQVRRGEGAITVSVPPKTYPGADGKFPSVADVVYRFPLEF